MARLLAALQSESARRQYVQISEADAIDDDCIDQWYDEVSLLETGIESALDGADELTEKWELHEEKIGEVLSLDQSKFSDEQFSALAGAYLDAGLESGDETDTGVSLQSADRDEVTLQVFKRARDTLKRMVQWFVKLYQKITRKIYKWFQKHVGFVARAKRKNDKLRNRMEKMQGWTLDEKKVDVNGWATALQVGGVLKTSASDIVSEIGELASIVTQYGEYLTSMSKVSEKLPEAIADVDGTGVEKFNEANKSASDVTYGALKADAEFSKFNTIVTNMRNVDNTAANQKICRNLTARPENGDTRHLKNATVSCMKNKGLIGNMNLFRVTSAFDGKSLSDAATAIRSTGFFLLEYKQDMKKTKNDGKIDTADLSQCEGIVTSIDQLLDEMGILMNGDEMYRVRQDLDKANDNYQKKIKEFNKLEFTSNVRGILSVLAAEVTQSRRVFTDTPMKLARLARGTVNAGQRYVSASLSNHKKESNS